MIHIFVETNFVLEQVFTQKEAKWVQCIRDLLQKKPNLFKGYIPFFSFIEAFQKIDRVKFERKNDFGLSNNAIDKMNGFTSSSYSDFMKKIENIKTDIELLNKQEKSDCKKIINEIRTSQILEIIPLYDKIYLIAESYREKNDLNFPDSLIAASFSDKIDTIKTEDFKRKIVITKDKKHFDDPAIKQILAGALQFNSFEGGFNCCKQLEKTVVNP